MSKANYSRMHTRGPSGMNSKMHSVAKGGRTNVPGVGEGGAKSSAIQVIFNGKIATPQSLLSRKAPPKDAAPKEHAAWAPKKQGDQTTGVAMTLEESSEFVEKAQLAKMKSKADATAGATDPRGGKLATGGSTVAKKVEVEEMVTVLLTETATETVLALPALVAATDLREIAQTDERNARYDAVVQAHKIADGGFSHRPTQTLNNPQKNQNDMAAPSALRDFGVQVMAYEITDDTLDGGNMAYDGDLGGGIDDGTDGKKDRERAGSISLAAGGNVLGGGGKHVSTGTGTDTDGGLDVDRLSESVKKFVMDTVTLSLVTPGCQLDITDLSPPPAPGEGREARQGGARHGRGRGSVTTGVTGMYSGAQGKDHSSANQSRVSSDRDSDDEGGKKYERRKSRQGSMTGTTLAIGAGKKDDAQSSGMQSQSAMASSRMQSHDGDKSENWAPVELSEEETKQVLRDEEAERILSSKHLLKRLLMLERAVQQNAYHRQHLDYRDLPDVAPVSLRRTTKAGAADGGAADHGHFGASLGGVGLGSPLGATVGRGKGLPGAPGQAPASPHSATASLAGPPGEMGAPGDATVDGSAAGAAADAAEGGGAKVKKLFCYFSAELVQGRSVTTMAWNSVNSDLLAVGYGKLDNFVDNSKLGEAVDEQLQGGLVLFWSLRNPEHPEKVLRTPHPVVSLDFSKLQPMWLAVGLTNGDVNIYDVKREVDWSVPVHSSAGLAGDEAGGGAPPGHTDPVCQLKWVVRRTERFERFETLISISNDGNVLEWNTKKGFVVSTLMQLKRAGMGEGWISRQAAGLCFDFVPSDPSTYVTGTEEGSIHKCSVSYNEQYLDTYAGHQGPVYRVKFSPRWHSVFLSCSADWSMGLYHLRAKAPLLTFAATGEHTAVNDVAWCPDNATIFAAITADAKLQIWDLAVSSIDPVVVLDTSVDDVLVARDGAADAAAADAALLDLDDALDGGYRHDGSMQSLASSSATGAVGAAGSRRLAGRSQSQVVAARSGDAANAPVARLMKALAHSTSARSLTTLLFGEKSPTLAVGDNRGAVTVYRVLDPPTITHEGPLQQMARLKAAIRAQSDPSSAARLATLEGPVAGDEDGDGNDNASAAGTAAGAAAGAGAPGAAAAGGGSVAGSKKGAAVDGGGSLASVEADMDLGAGSSVAEGALDGDEAEPVVEAQ